MHEPPAVDSSAATTPIAGAERSALVGCVQCGQLLPSSKPTGRPRQTCSDACRRQRDYLTRRLRRRLEWIEGWKAIERAGTQPRAHIRSQLAQLRREQQELLEALRQAPTATPRRKDAAA